MNDPNYSMVRGRPNTNGDDTRPVVNNAPPAADINTVIPAASVNPRYNSSPPH
jgi:hypothetical protein